ncbi:hypothetical protein K438DRAFT_1162483 [Mycena galopus ATCC 62051]|nr:hypothetical protein K438DRAFT_1162483 [Mycena galopus ATCC 62051]
MPAIDLRRRLAELDEQIAEHRRVLHELEETRIAVERELFASPFPVLSLPAEVTAEIFIRCLPPFANLGWSRRIDEYENAAPVSLMRVCHAWRDIAIATSTLWSVLDVPFDIISASFASKQGCGEDFIDRWLARAGQRPLSFVFRAITGWEPGEDDIEPFPPRMRDLIHCYSHRLQYLELYTIAPHIHHLGLDSTEFPVLERVSLNCDAPAGDRFWDGQATVVNIFSHAPQFHELLRHPRPTDDTIFRANIWVALPWSQLTKYDGPIQNLVLFTEASSLTEVTCYLEYLEDDTTPVTHSGLKSLTVKDWGPGLGLLQYLTLPALKYLDVIAARASGNALEPFLNRSSPPLVSLCIQAGGHYSQVWDGCIRCVRSTLENLELHRPTTEAMECLFPFHYESFISRISFAKLRSLRLQDVSCDYAWHYSSIVRFLSSAPHLRSFEFVWTDSILDIFDQGKEFDDLARIARAGMKIYFGSGGKNYAPIDSSP